MQAELTQCFWRRRGVVFHSSTSGLDSDEVRPIRLTCSLREDSFYFPVDVKKDVGRPGPCGQLPGHHTGENLPNQESTGRRQRTKKWEERNRIFVLVFESLGGKKA